MKKKTTPKPIKAHRGRIVYGPRRPPISPWGPRGPRNPWNPWGGGGPRPRPMPWGGPRRLPQPLIRPRGPTDFPVPWGNQLPKNVRKGKLPTDAVDLSRVGTPTAQLPDSARKASQAAQSALRIPNPISQAPTRIANKGMLVPKKKAKGHHDYRKSGYFSKGGIIKKKKS